MPAHPFEKAADHTRPHGSHRYDVFAPKPGIHVREAKFAARLGQTVHVPKPHFFHNLELNVSWDRDCNCGRRLTGLAHLVRDLWRLPDLVLLSDTFSSPDGNRSSRVFSAMTSFDII